MNSPSPPFGLATDHISVHNGSAETLHVPVIYKEYAEEALQEMSCTVNMQEATKKATILKEKILGFLKGCATKPGTIDLSKNNVDMDIRSFIAHYCFPRFNGIDREKAKKRYFFYNCDHFSPYLFIALQGFVDRQGLKKFAAIALLIGNDSSFLEAVDQQIDRIKGELLSKKESFFKTLADARSAVCQYTTEKKLNLDHVKHQNYSRSFDNLPPLYDNEIKEVTGILERRGLLKKDEYGSAICNMASEHFGRYSTEVSIFEIFFLSRYGI
ncbi:hypothetical protein FACS1894122_07450 [Alphaproteobacteria bacterium]|nr:hypothetical protein FACS1894122_07450 [Alphaproteobacteria bacterium]